MRNRGRCYPALVIAALFWLPQARADDCGGTSSVANDCGTLLTLSISALHKVDDTFQAIKDKGALNWARDSVKSYLDKKSVDLFGSASPAAESVVKAGGHAYGIQSQGMDAINKDLTTFSAGGSGSAGDAFFDFLGRDKVPDMLKSIAPESVRTVTEKIETVVDNAKYLSDKAQSAADSVAARFKTYFDDGASYGLEPGGKDVQAVKSEAPALKAEMAKAAVETGSSSGLQAEKQSPAAEQIAQGTSKEEPETESRQDVEGRHDLQPASKSSASPRVPKGFEQDAADLAAELGVSRDGRAKSAGDDAAELAASLGVSSAKASSGPTNWAEEARRADADTNAWEAEQARLAALKQQQAELRRQREQARRQQDELVAQQRARQAAEREAAAADAEPDEPLPSRHPTQPSRKGSLLGALVNGYLQGKYGISTPSAAPRSPGVPYGGGSAGADCTPPAVIDLLSQCTNSVRSEGVCQTARTTASCMVRAESECGGCDSCILNARALRRQAEATAQQSCAGN